MRSAIVDNLKPEFEPVAVVWSDTLPSGTFQFKEGKFGCVLYLFAHASRQGKIAGGSRETILCTGGRAALGFGADFDATDQMLETHAALFSKGLQSAMNRDAYQKEIDAVPHSWQDMFTFGERRHSSLELAKEWILHEVPRYDIEQQYVLFKPLSSTSNDENIRAVIFPVNPLELSGLITLAGSVMKGTDPVRVPQGTDCCSIGAFPYAEAESCAPKAVLGMMGTDGRETMRKRFRDDTLTLTLPIPLFLQLEKEAEDCVFHVPAWKNLVGREQKR